MADMREKIEDAGGRIKGVAEKLGDQARGAAEKASEASSGFVGSMKEKARDVGAGTAELAGKAKDTAQQWASSVGGAAVQTKDRAQEMASAAVEKAGDLGQEATKLIRSYPLQAILAGVGVGFLLGIALRRSS